MGLSIFSLATQVSPASAGDLLSRSQFSFGGFVPSRCSELISRATKHSETQRLVELAGAEGTKYSQFNKSQVDNILTMRCIHY